MVKFSKLSGNNKFILLTKPAQSGKTFVMLNSINDEIIDPNIINIIYCDNNLLLTNQTNLRLCDNFNKLLLKNKVNDPKVNDPKVNDSKVNDPKVDDPKVNDPKVNDPKVNNNKVNDPKVDDPKVNDPKVDDPKVNDPKVDDPKVDESKVMDLKMRNKCFSVMLSSISDFRNIEKVFNYIKNGITRNISMCSNKFRVNDLNKLLDMIKNTDYKINIWIDEADRSLKLFREYFHRWNNNNYINKVSLITATPRQIFSAFYNIKIYKFRKCYDSKIYHRFVDNKFYFVNHDSETIEDYIEHVLDNNKIKSNSNWLIPGKFYVKSHNSICKLCLKRGFSVIVINGSGFKLYKNKKDVIIYDKTKSSPTELFKKVYKEENLANCKLAITGNSCISRGITIQSTGFIIDNAILSHHIVYKKNNEEAYQMAARLSGNIKEFINYTKPNIYINESFYRNIVKAEHFSFLGEYAFNNNKDIIYRNDLLTLNKNGLTSKNNMEIKLKEYKLENVNTNDKWNENIKYYIRRLYNKTDNKRFGPKFNCHFDKKRLENGFYRANFRDYKKMVLSYTIMTTKERNSGFKIGEVGYRIQICYKDLNDPKTGVVLLRYQMQTFRKSL
jgi:hypothetical protein